MSEIRLEAEYPFALIWRNIFHGIFSNIGRIAALANCCNLVTGEYEHPALSPYLGSNEADGCMRIAHELLWNEWIIGSLEQQHADILLYSRDALTSIRDILSHWIESLPAPALPPVSATQESRALFASNVKLFLSLQMRQLSESAEGHAPEEKLFTAVLDQTVCYVRERYAEPNLSLKALSRNVICLNDIWAASSRNFLGKLSVSICEVCVSMKPPVY